MTTMSLIHVPIPRELCEIVNRYTRYYQLIKWHTLGVKHYNLAKSEPTTRWSTVRHPTNEYHTLTCIKLLFKSRIHDWSKMICKLSPMNFLSWWRNSANRSEKIKYAFDYALLVGLQSIEVSYAIIWKWYFGDYKQYAVDEFMNVIKTCDSNGLLKWEQKIRSIHTLTNNQEYLLTKLKDLITPLPTLIINPRSFPTRMTLHDVLQSAIYRLAAIDASAFVIINRQPTFDRYSFVERIDASAFVNPIQTIPRPKNKYPKPRPSPLDRSEEQHGYRRFKGGRGQCSGYSKSYR